MAPGLSSRGRMVIQLAFERSVEIDWQPGRLETGRELTCSGPAIGCVVSDPRITYQKIASLLVEASEGLAPEQFEQMAFEALEDVSPNEIAEIVKFLPVHLTPLLPKKRFN
jgi:hypothetical protein